MSTPHSRLFEASLASLLLADRDEEEVSAGIPVPGQWHKPMANSKIRAEAEGSIAAEEPHAPLS
jgi:hypothetical protein